MKKQPLRLFKRRALEKGVPMIIDYKPRARGTCIKHHQADVSESQYILVHQDKPVWSTINKIGSEIFSLLNGDNSIGDIAQQLSRSYGEPFGSVLLEVKAFIAQLAKKKFLFPSDQEELKPQAFAKIDIPPILKSIHLNITENCNLHCRHCGVTDGTKSKDFLTTKQIFSIIDEAREAKVKLFAITGGEPLLREDCLEILSFSSKRVKTSLATNGVLINEQTACILADLDLTLQISLDGPNEFIHDYLRGQGSFAKTMKAIELLNKRGVGEKIAFCVTVNKHNINHIPDIFQLAQKVGVTSIRFIPIQKLGMATLHWEDLALSITDYSKLYHYLYQEAPVQFPFMQFSPGFQGFVLQHPPQQAMWCQIGQMMAIDAKGDLYPCPLLMEPPFKAGNIQKMSLQEALASPAIDNIKQNCLLRKKEIAECTACLWKHFCQGGCTGSIYRLKGSFYEVDDLCTLRKKFYPEFILAEAHKRAGLKVNKKLVYLQKRKK